MRIKKDRLKKLIENAGSNDILRAQNFNKKINDLVENNKLNRSDISIRDLDEAVNTTIFSIIMGNLLSKEFFATFEKESGIGLELISKLPSNLKTDEIPGVFTESSIKEVTEGEGYHHTGMIKERYVKVGAVKYGEILDITEESIRNDQTGLILLEARNYGETLAQHLEEHIMKVIQDATSAWYPSGTQTTLYSNTASGAHFKDNLITNALEDYTDLDAAKILIGKMTVSANNDSPINVRPNVLLVPLALETKAQRLIGSSSLPGAANDEANPYKNRYDVKSSVYLDSQSATAWYLGNFKKQYVYKEVIPPQLLVRNDEKNPAAWERDVKYQFKIRYKGKAAARDFRAVVKSDGSV
ncbi:MAG: hypothetical protein KGY74_05330 [Candidatus Cloacimonetes bacterium]|nr:hypothetical protein [Candidatus Cloacimonadota bacterium]